MKNYSFGTTVKTLAGLLAIFISAQAGWSAVIGSPFPATLNASSPYPFLAITTEGSMRYQQVYGASDFSSISGGGGMITALRFDPMAPTVAVDVNLQSIEIHLSTTPRLPDTLNTLFAANVGADDRIVYSGPLHFFTASVNAFSTVVPVTPFFYAPSQGNLLLDVRNYVASVPQPPFNPRPVLKASAVTGDTVSMQFSFDAFDTTADFVGTAGLITVFEVTPVPEPSTGALLFAGLAMFALARRRKAKRRTPTMT